jgi:hypothetical protein
MMPYTVDELEIINHGTKKENAMFDVNEFIDTVQTAKKTAVKVMVPNEVVAKSLNGFVDAQTEYTKEAYKATTSAFGTIANEMSKTVESFINGAHFKKMQEDVKNDIYTTFWKEAFNRYGMPYGK